MKILLINQTFFPDSASSGQHLTDLAVDLVNVGHEVEVLTSRRGYSHPERTYPKREEYQGIRIRRTWPFSLGRRFKIARILDAFFLNVSFAWELCWMPRYDKIIAMTSPPLVAWIALQFARWKESEFIYWMMDINPDQAIIAGWIKKDSFQAKVLEVFLATVLRQSQKIVVLDSFMKNYIVAKGADRERIAVIAPWSHDEDLETVPHEKNPFKKEHGLQDKFVVMYSGNHSICHPLDTILNAALALRDREDVVFAFVGGGERVGEVTRFKRKHELGNIMQLPYQNREDLKYSLSAADLHITVMGEQYVSIVHSCKIYGILQLGRPFGYVGPTASHIGEIIAQCGEGYQIEEGDFKRLIEVIDEVSNYSADDKQKVLNKEKEFAEEYSRDILSQRLVNFVTEIG